MKNSLLILTLLTLCACGAVMIGENNYRLLSDSQKKFIRPFDQAIVSSQVNNGEQLYLYEINTDNVKEVLASNRYTWIHVWPPNCHGTMCENINYFQRISDKLKAKGVEFLLISNSYDLLEIRKKLANSEYNKPIFVFQDSYYGHKSDKARLDFHDAFKNSQISATKYGFSDYLFRDTTLIYGGNDLTGERVDSLMVLL